MGTEQVKVGVDPHKVRISSGVKFNLRGPRELAELFPDGCKITHTCSPHEGRQLVLRNRVGGRKFAVFDAKRSIHALTLTKVEGEELPEFGAVSPEQMTVIRGGLLLTFPEELPELRKMVRGAAKGKAAAKPAKPSPAPVGAANKPAEPVAAAKPSPAPQPAPEAVEPTPAEGQFPSISLPEAVQAVNAWKRLLGQNATLEILPDGRLRATAEYQ